MRRVAWNLVERVVKRSVGMVVERILWRGVGCVVRRDSGYGSGECSIDGNRGSVVFGDG